MKFTGSKGAFGRHETFALRYGWLTKGVQELNKGVPVFEAEDATVRLGVGKNMVASIRYWLQATQIIEASDDGWKLSEVGDAIFGDKGYDPYLEDDATIWLLHWLLATNPELATTWWWFFNRYHKPEFTSTELTTALQDFAESNLKGRHTANTLKRDAAVLLRMYVRSSESKRIPIEEALDSPLSILGLVSRTPESTTLESRPSPRPDLPPGVLGYAIVDHGSEKSSFAAFLTCMMENIPMKKTGGYYSADRWTTPRLL